MLTGAAAKFRELFRLAEKLPGQSKVKLEINPLNGPFIMAQKLLLVHEILVKRKIVCLEFIQNSVVITFDALIS